MRKFLVAILISTVVLTPAPAADRYLATGRYEQEPRKTGFTKLWKISVALLAAANVADVHSSWGRPELNPALAGPNGRFGMQGIAVKSLIVSGVVTAQYLMLRNHPKASKYGAWTNLAMAGVLSAAAASNYHRHWNVPRPAVIGTTSPR